MQIAGANESDMPVDLASLLRERRSAGEPVRAVSEMPAKGKARLSLAYENGPPAGRLRRGRTKTTPAGYLKEIFVKEAHRRKG